MSLFKKILGSITLKPDHQEDKSKFMPEHKPPIDEEFTINFKSNGGKFLYCENLDELFESFNNILIENNWTDKNALIIDKNLQQKFKSLKIKTSQISSEASYFLSTCENLIANDGSLLISSNQIAENKISEFPNNFIIYATTSQITQTISEGLQRIKKNSPKKIPSNITTIKHFKNNPETDNFLSYGCNPKNVYLLLLEDL